MDRHGQDIVRYRTALPDAIEELPTAQHAALAVRQLHQQAHDLGRQNDLASGRGDQSVSIRESLPSVKTERGGRFAHWERRLKDSTSRVHLGSSLGAGTAPGPGLRT